MDLSFFLENIRFTFIKPSTGLPRGFKRFENLIKKHLPFDYLNTQLPGNTNRIKSDLYELSLIPRMSTVAIGAIINFIVRSLPDNQSYVNVGVWNGFSLLSGMKHNEAKNCIGIDNFSMWGGPREDFMERFDKLKSDKHQFHDMDYEAYFANKHNQDIGLYFYDGNHEYEHQLKGLKIAEPYFSDDCIILVDDTNWDAARQATLDFMKDSKHHYEIIFDRTTSRYRIPENESSMHPTFWNGVMLIQKVR